MKERILLDPIKGQLTNQEAKADYNKQREANQTMELEIAKRMEEKQKRIDNTQLNDLRRELLGI